MEPEQEQEHIESVLRKEISQVDTPERARAVLEKAEKLAGDATQEQRGKAVAQAPPSAVESVDRASEAGGPVHQAAATLETVAAEAVAPTSEAATVSTAAERVVSPTAPTPPETRRGLALLRHALLERLQPHEAVDARLYLAVNSLPHPRWADRLADRVTVFTNGGWIWLGAAAVASIIGVPNGRCGLRELAPPLIVTTWIVEHPVKSFFRRKRPFIDIIRALVVGKKPGTWSFPSGHTASSFAAATILSRCWPAGAKLFYIVAAMVGFSRVYVGAHYPGDVAAGASVGVILASVTRLVVAHILKRFD